MERRKRRSFTEEFKAEAVRLAREGTKALPQLAKDLDLLQVIDEPANIVDAIFAFYEAREDLLSTQSKEPGAYL